MQLCACVKYCRPRDWCSSVSVTIFVCISVSTKRQETLYLTPKLFFCLLVYCIWYRIWYDAWQESLLVLAWCAWSCGTDTRHSSFDPSHDAPRTLFPALERSLKTNQVHGFTVYRIQSWLACYLFEWRLLLVMDELTCQLFLFSARTK